MKKIGSKIKAKHMILENWYRTDDLGRFVCGGFACGGLHGEKWAIIYLDGDRDMQSQAMLPLEEIVEVADPKG